MGVKVEIDVSGVSRKLRRIASDPRVGAEASTEAARLMQPFVPNRTGALESSADTSKPFEVTYTMPYARRLYYGDGFNFYKENNPRACSRWGEKIDHEALIKTLETFIEERL